MLRNFNYLQGFRLAYIMSGPFRAIPSICNQRSLHYLRHFNQSRTKGIFNKMKTNKQEQNEYKTKVKSNFYTKLFFRYFNFVFVLTIKHLNEDTNKCFAFFDLGFIRIQVSKMSVLALRCTFFGKRLTSTIIFFVL